VVQGSLALGDTVVGSLTVRPGATLQLLGTRLEVDGDLLIESGGAIKGTQPRLDLIVRKNLMIQGPVESPGHLVLVDDPAKLPSLDRLEQQRDTLTFDVIDGPATAPATLREWRIQAPLRARQSAGAPSPVAPAAAAAGTGRRGGTVYVNFVGNAVVSPGPNQSGQIPWDLQNDGGNGLDQTGCNVVGDDGGLGGNLVMAIEGTLVLNDMLISGGNGGHGGDAIGDQPCRNGSVNRAGAGGKPGTIHISVARFGLVLGALVLNNVGIVGWDGGAGGDATIIGMDGAQAGANGAFVTAKGGPGASLVGRRLYIGPNVVIGPGGLRLRVLNSDDGGSADAAGGKGIPGVCDANTGIAGKSGDGGKAVAEGGAGGMVGNVTLSGNLAPGIDITRSFEPGVGGDATATGGLGADGVQCHAKGGDGGHGGTAQGDGGRGGIGGIAGGLIYRDGTGIANGGAGGNGGFAGNRGGDGGDGGPAAAAGNKASKASGGAGGDGGDVFNPWGTGGTGGDGGNASSLGFGAPDPNPAAGDHESFGGRGGNAGCPNGAPGKGGDGKKKGLDGDGC
jgi:hypothetical protein